MKIGIDARLWNETGVGRYIRNLIKNLYLIDKENDYVIFALPQDFSDIQLKTQNALPAMLRNARQAGKFKIVSTNIRWHSVMEQVQLPGILMKENLDVMHFPYFSLPLIYNKPFVVTIHDLIIYHYPTGKASTLPLPLYKLKHVGYKTLIRQTVKNARKIIVPLDSVKQDLINTLHVNDVKVRVTTEGVDDNLLVNKNVRSEKQEEISTTKNEILFSKFLLYVGNAYPHKNIDTLLKAFIRFKQTTTSDIKLLLVGKEDYFYKKLQENITMYSLKDIQILHDVSDLMLHDLYTQAIALISPSFMEGFGLVPLEAMANSCLVIASNIPAHREVCSNVPLYFDPNKPAELVEKFTIVSTMDTEAKLKRVSEGIQRVNAFSWETMAKETKKIYESCLSI